MKVSVVVCTYAMDRYSDFAEAVRSALDQTYEPIEIVLVSDGNERVADRMREDFGDRANVRVHNNDENRGISYSRTRGAELASGDLVAFLDDDAIATPEWIETLVETYESTDAYVVGGRLDPQWVAGEPSFLPEEFYWLIGCTEKGFADHLEEVRNTYGSNIAFDREVFLDVGGYDEETGRKGDSHVQAHEAPACIRVREQYGRGVVYNEEAVVFHKIFKYRTDFRWLVGRAFWQGYSKRVMNLRYPEDEGNEGEYLRDLTTRDVPGRLRSLLADPTSAKLAQLLAIFVFTAAVGFGYLYGVATYRNR
ncbi:glucosyl-dolichyl phosphate glucuronosyltransferase [Halorubrum distributum]|uniref:Glycosyltransferase AglG n=1 Tax=Halorubrum distributum JCM 10247 TaxID=1227486 RepID=M0DMH9_9EURY|nr:glucosyl-dolichyl phosphate glucuronosyltransferase [Halorubrum terrestre]ELZ35993.1 glycosyltransferase AglG [Halorubrum terrestre JCM 10247]